MLDRRGMALVLAGGVLFGFGLGYSRMAEPEIVLAFLQLTDLGLLFVMGGAVVVTASVFALATRTDALDRAPLTGEPYATREKSFDNNVLSGGAIFGVGWGLSGICPGAAYASLGIGNYPILLGIAGMFIGAYVQGLARSYVAGADTAADPS